MGLGQKALLSGGRRFSGFACTIAAASSFLAASAALAEPALVMDINTGDVVYEDHATSPWYPASLTKLMTVYVALSAVRDHKIALDTPLVVSARAASQAPSKMGFAPGTQVTLDNALKMLMVKSANDMAVTIAEGVSGSVEAFAEDMNAAAASLGLRQSHFVNPNGLHDPAHISSARDLAVIARTLYLTFPEEAGIYSIGALQIAGETIPTHNSMLGRYPGADGMKTGFTCSSGFNIVAGATRNNHHYIAVVLGAPSVVQREVKAAILLDRAFDGIDHPLPGLAPQAAATPPDMHERVCKHGRVQSMARFQTELKALQAPLATQASSFVADNALFVAAPNPVQEANLMGKKLMAAVPVFDPVSVSVGTAPGYAGMVAQARPAHSPVGTEPPPATASAYAADKAPGLAAGEIPLKPDVAALPMKGHQRRSMAPLTARKAVAKAKAAEEVDEAPATAKVRIRTPIKGGQQKAIVEKTAQYDKKVLHHGKAATKASGDTEPAHAAKPAKGDAK